MIYNGYIIFCFKLSSTSGTVENMKRNDFCAKVRPETHISRSREALDWEEIKWQETTCVREGKEREQKVLIEKEKTRKSEKRKVWERVSQEHNSKSNTIMFSFFKIYLFCVIFNKKEQKTQKGQILVFFHHLCFSFWILII